jgi:4-amino-4-deoxy-L-arabinose transferase-like glycosyltransferase
VADLAVPRAARRVWGRDDAGRRPWHRAALVGVAGLAAVLDTWGLSQNGFGNPYYAAAVRSMLESWHDFFFLSLDAGGFVSVDKPPLALWLQALSAKLLGYGWLSLLLPEALAGVLAVIVLYRAVGRTWGAWAGVLAALALAVSPVDVVVWRDNNVDALLVLLLVMAAAALLRAVESGRLRWLLAAAALVGLGFNTKMLAAYVALPALGLAYLAGARHGAAVRALHLSAAALVVAGLSAAWLAAVDLTPASQRPYVGSTRDNSAVSLAIGYNGLNRIVGFHRPAGGPPPATAAGSPGAARDAFAGGGGFPFGGGRPGPLRLLTGQVAAQWSWLLPLAVVGGVSALVTAGAGTVRGPRLASLVLWGGWLATGFALFSEASGIFHPYYLSQLGPPLAAAAGIGGAGLARDLAAGRRRRLLAGAAIAVTSAFQVSLLREVGELEWLAVPAVAAAGLGLAAGFLRGRAVASAALVAGLAAVLVAPAGWAAASLGHPGSGPVPTAGPSAAAMPGPATRGRGAGGSARRTGLVGPVADPERLIAYVTSRQRGERWVLATDSSMTASPLIIRTGRPIMAMGGFSGSDPVLDAPELGRLVSSGQVRFFLVGAGGGPFSQRLDGRVARACPAVPRALWGGPLGPGVPGAGLQPDGFPARGSPWHLALYDCRGRGRQLAD